MNLYNVDEIKDFKFGLSICSDYTREAGLSLRDTVTALVLFQENGMSFIDGATSLNYILVGLCNDVKFLNHDVIKPLNELAGVLESFLNPFSVHQRLTILHEKVGSHGIYAGTILFKAGYKGVEDMANSNTVQDLFLFYIRSE